MSWRNKGPDVFLKEPSAFRSSVFTSIDVSVPITGARSRRSMDCHGSLKPVRTATPAAASPPSGPWQKCSGEKGGLPPISASPIHFKISVSSKGNWLAVPFFRVLGLAPRAASGDVVLDKNRPHRCRGAKTQSGSSSKDAVQVQEQRRGPAQRPLLSSENLLSQRNPARAFRG